MKVNARYIQRLVFVIANAAVLVLLTLAGNAVSKDKDGTGALMEKLDIARRIYADYTSGAAVTTPAEVAREYFPVNIGYDREMVPAVDEFGIPAGMRPVVSRGRLAQFLDSIEGSPYKSIIVDVQFFKADSTPADSTLFAAINRIPNLLVSANADEDAVDTIDPDRLASSEYNYTPDEGNFVKYHYDHGDIRDMALSTYNIRNKTDVTLAGWFPTDNGRLAGGSLALSIPYTIESAYDADGNKTYYNLGADLLDVYSREELAELVRGKTIVIGDYVGGDDHETYTGTVAGPVILINAVMALEHHRHIINWWWMSAFFIVYALLNLMLVCDPAKMLPGRLGESRLCRFVITGLSFGIVIVCLNVVMYLFTGVIYDLYFPTLWLTILYFIKDHENQTKPYIAKTVSYIRKFQHKLQHKKI